MRISLKDIKPCKFRVQGFTGEVKESIENIDLFVELGDGARKIVRVQKFVIVDFLTFNVFLGRLTLLISE